MTVVEQVLAPVVTERERRARVLEAAALEIEVRGWTQSCAMNSRGNVCLVGAILCAAGEPIKENVLYGRLEVAARAWGDGYGGTEGDPLPMAWNDGRAIDAQDVTFVLRWRAQEIRDGR